MLDDEIKEEEDDTFMEIQLPDDDFEPDDEMDSLIANAHKRSKQKGNMRRGGFFGI